MQPVLLSPSKAAGSATVVELWERAVSAFLWTRQQERDWSHLPPVISVVSPMLLTSAKANIPRRITSSVGYGNIEPGRVPPGPSGAGWLISGRPGTDSL
jgi:hypothetical protein